MTDNDTGIPGALYGSRLIEQPHVKHEVDFVRNFVHQPALVFVEIGFDHGFRLIDIATRNPRWRCLGIEVRKRRVTEVTTLAKGLELRNLHAWRMDARTVFSKVIPAGSVDVLDILYPTPWWDQRKREKRLLIQPNFLSNVHRSLKLGGVVRIETDVEDYAIHIQRIFEQITGFKLLSRTLSDEGLRCQVLSRRQKKQVRDKLQRWCYTYAKSENG